MKRTFAALAAGVLILGGAAVALAQTGDSTPDDSTTTKVWPERGDTLDEVLSELVADGTIKQDQADAIVDAFEAKRAERRAEMEALRAEHEAARDAMRAAWEDGVLTREEIEQFPNSEWLLSEDSPLADALEDGKITRDELGFRGRGLGGRFGGGFGGGFHHHHGEDVGATTGTDA